MEKSSIHHLLRIEYRLEDTINDADDELAAKSQNKVKNKLSVEVKGRGKTYYTCKMYKKCSKTVYIMSHDAYECTIFKL